ncbi:hypothetical protein ACN4EK_15450 [Pantanalinema rosaneae CENA516]|uniref:hypothetical protein n=1 Tax=Pantanalinema rosaneae TaxID=1620701 RepID=UPI003D6DF3BB
MDTKRWARGFYVLSGRSLWQNERALSAIAELNQQKSDPRRLGKVTQSIQVLHSRLLEASGFMQGRVVELIRELMQAQRLSIRKISARIAQEYGGSEMGYTQQINRILNDPDYDPSFSTVQKILFALNYSIWQGTPIADLTRLEQRLDQMSGEIADLKQIVSTLRSRSD